jgi:cytochrome c6
MRGREWKQVRQGARRCWAGLAGLLLATGVHANDPEALVAKGKLLFTQQAVPACAVCHTLQDARSKGAVGPNLDELKPDAQRVANAVRQGLGNMPSFRDSLSDDDVEALARYVYKVSAAR